jgi:HAD superfamily hydrolase (TIGR01509 family)
MLSTLLFDFGGTLDADGVRWCVRFHQAYRAAGGMLPLEEFEPAFRASDRELEARDAVRRLGFRAMIELQAALLRGLLPDGHRLDFTRVADAFWSESVAVVRRNRALLERLRARHRLGVVSNFTGNLDRCLAELDLLRLFAITVDSLVVGIAKPEPGIFRYALDALGARPESSWMVGDNLEADIRPAAAVGLSTCWLTPADRAAADAALATACISRLTEFPALLDPTCTV